MRRKDYNSIEEHTELKPKREHKAFTRKAKQQNKIQSRDSNSAPLSILPFLSHFLHFPFFFTSIFWSTNAYTLYPPSISALLSIFHLPFSTDFVRSHKLDTSHVPVRKLNPEEGGHELVCQRGRWAPKGDRWGSPMLIGERNEC